MCICFSAFALHPSLSFTFLFSCMKTPSCWKSGAGDSCRCMNKHYRIALISFVDVLSEFSLFRMSRVAARYNVGFFPQPLVAFLFLFSIYRLMNTGLRIRDASPLQSGAYFLFAMLRHYFCVLVLLGLRFSCSEIHVFILLKDQGKVKSWWPLHIWSLFILDDALIVIFAHSNASIATEK